MADRDPDAATPKLIAIAVVELNDEFLVGVRPNGPLAGYCEFPGGKVRQGETPADAAARECLEETGIPVSIGPLLVCTRHEYTYGLLELHFYAAAPRDARLIPTRPFRWAARAELATLQFPPANEAVLAMLRNQSDSARDAASLENRCSGAQPATVGRFTLPLDINSRRS